MSEPVHPVPEADLQALVDDQLPEARRRLVEARLAADPAASARLAAYRAQQRQLRAAFAGPDVPLRLDTLRRSLQRQRRLQLATAGLLLGAVGFGAALWGPWSGRGSGADAVLANLARSAFAAHHNATAMPPAPKPDAAATQRVAQFLSSRLHRTIMPPDLSRLGYRLVMARVLDSDRDGDGDSAALLYRGPQDSTLTLVLRGTADADLRGQRDAEQGTDRLCAWVRQGLAGAVVAALPEQTLGQVMQATIDTMPAQR